MHYILDKNKNVIPATSKDWSDFLEDMNNRIVKQEYIEEFLFSTLFLGMDHSFNYFIRVNHPDYKPYVFETIVFEENDLKPILELLIHDKKNEYGKVQFALINGIGKIIINQSVENELIIKSFEDYKT